MFASINTNVLWSYKRNSIKFLVELLLSNRIYVNKPGPAQVGAISKAEK